MSGARPFNPADYEFFPATLQAIDSTAKFVFTGDGKRWIATVKKSEYAPHPIKELTLVLAGKNHSPPMSLMWRADGSKSD